MRKISLIFSLLLCFTVQAISPDELFAQATEQYQNSDFEGALQSYETILQQGVESEEVYFNMANCYYKLGSVGKSILYYERARQFDPHDDDIRQNLEIAQQATIDRFEELPKPIVRTAYLGLIKLFNPSTWAWIGMVLLFSFLTGLSLYYFTAVRRVGFIAAVFALFLSLFSFSMAYAHQGYLASNKPAVIMATSSYVKSGPSENAEDVFILHEGTLATVSEDFEGWKKIKIADGKVGWIAAEDIEEI